MPSVGVFKVVTLQVALVYNLQRTFILFNYASTPATTGNWMVSEDLNLFRLHDLLDIDAGVSNSLPR